MVYNILIRKDLGHVKNLDDPSELAETITRQVGEAGLGPKIYPSPAPGLVFLEVCGLCDCLASEIYSSWVPELVVREVPSTRIVISIENFFQGNRRRRIWAGLWAVRALWRPGAKEKLLPRLDYPCHSHQFGPDQLQSLWLNHCRWKLWASYDCQILQNQKDIIIMIVVIITAGGGFG